MEQAGKADGYCEKILRGTVVEFSGDSPAFLVLHIQEAGGKSPQFHLDAPLLGDVLIDAHHGNNGARFCEFRNDSGAVVFLSVEKLSIFGLSPTELGLRFFVDALMQVGDLNDSERRQIEAQVAGAGKSVDNVLNDASVLLSGLTRAAGVVLTDKSNVRLKHIEFVRLDPERALAVMVSEDGQVENRVVNVPLGLPTSALTEAGNFLNARIRGKTLAEVRAELERALAAGQAELDQLTQKVVAAGLASWSGGNDEERRLIVRGQAHLLEDLKALADLERVRLLFDDLELRRELIDLLGRAERAEGVRIFIGSENKLFSLSGSSTIIAPYHDRAGRIVGVIGVIGPTRLNYARVIPMVDYTAKVVGKLLAG